MPEIKPEIDPQEQVNKEVVEDNRKNGYDSEGKKVCNHTLRHNKEKDFVFCWQCGERWGVNCNPEIVYVTKPQYIWYRTWC